MAHNVDMSTLKHNFNFGLVKPALDLSRTWAVLHLTQGCKTSEIPTLDAGRKVEEVISGAAWSGQSDFKLKAGARAADFEYGYTQTATFGTFYAQYAGEKPQLGSISVGLGLDATTFPDGGTTHRPWSSPNAANRQKEAGDVITCQHRDHPNIIFPLTMVNRNEDFKNSPAITNLLQLVKYSLSFHALLCERKKTGATLTPVASFRWEVAWGFELKYRQGKPQIVRNSSTKTFSAIVEGAPSLNADEEKQLPKTSGSLFNTEVNAMLQRAFRDQQSGLRRYDSTWFLNIPKDFFT